MKITYFILIILLRFSGLQVIASQKQDNEGRVHENLKNFFDSISRKDLPEGEKLHEVLKREVEGEQLAFQSLRKKVQQEVQDKHAALKIPRKREIHESTDGTSAQNHGTKGADRENVRDRKSWKREFDSYSEAVRLYDDFLRSMEERFEDEVPQSDAHLDDSTVYYANYILTTTDDQKRRHKKRNYDFRMNILDEVKEIRKINDPDESELENELETVRQRISGNDTSAEQIEQLKHGVGLLQEATHSFRSFVEENLEPYLSRELDLAEQGTTIHTWCSAGTCEHDDETYCFKDTHHLDWLEVNLHKIEELRSKVNLD